MNRIVCIYVTPIRPSVHPNILIFISYLYRIWLIPYCCDICMTLRCRNPNSNKTNYNLNKQQILIRAKKEPL